jgi:hypothetical protein
MRGALHAQSQILVAESRRDATKPNARTTNVYASGCVAWRSLRTPHQAVNVIRYAAELPWRDYDELIATLQTHHTFDSPDEGLIRFSRALRAWDYEVDDEERRATGCRVCASRLPIPMISAKAG